MVWETSLGLLGLEHKQTNNKKKKNIRVVHQIGIHPISTLYYQKSIGTFMH